MKPRSQQGDPVALGLRAGRGGAIATAIAIVGGAPRLVLSTFLVTADTGDELGLAPFTFAAKLPRPPNGAVSPDAEKAVAEGRRRQLAAAIRNLTDLVARLRKQGHEPIGAALLVNRAGWVTDLLQYSLTHPEHVAVAEGLAVRDALRGAFAHLEIEITDCDEKTLPAQAQVELAVAPDQLEETLKRIGADVKPWRKEHRTASLAAWHLLAQSVACPQKESSSRSPCPRGRPKSQDRRPSMPPER